jgi:hypothetical protein
VELFTSEGCSSCPPADELVGMVQKENPEKPIYILAYHVDYWDHQGWKDPYSDREYSKRQTKYAGWLKLQTVYTPQIIVNGKKEFVGSNKRALNDAISASLQEKNDHYLTFKPTVEKGQILIDYHTNGPLKVSDLVIGFIQKSGHSLVQRGENSGRALSHVQIVRKLVIGTLGAARGQINLAFPKDYKNYEWELIAFIQNNLNGEIFSAAKSDADNTHIDKLEIGK